MSSVLVDLVSKLKWLPQIEKQTLLAMAFVSHDDGTEIYASAEKLGQKIHRSESYIRKGRVALERRGLIAKRDGIMAERAKGLRPAKKKDSRLTNTYEFNITRIVAFCPLDSFLQWGKSVSEEKYWKVVSKAKRWTADDPRYPHYRRPFYIWPKGTEIAQKIIKKRVHLWTDEDREAFKPLMCVTEVGAAVLVQRTSRASPANQQCRSNGLAVPVFRPQNPNENGAFVEVPGAQSVLESVLESKERESEAPALSPSDAPADRDSRSLASRQQCPQNGQEAEIEILARKVENGFYRQGFDMTAKVQKLIREYLQAGVSKQGFSKAILAAASRLPSDEKKPGLWLAQNFSTLFAVDVIEREQREQKEREGVARAIAELETKAREEKAAREARAAEEQAAWVIFSGESEVPEESDEESELAGTIDKV